MQGKGTTLTRVRCAVTSFARKTGDIAVLSLADIRVLALCLTLELEENGSWRVRDTPGQVLTGPPKKEEEAAVEGAEALVPALEELKVDAVEVEEKSEEPVASTSGSVPTPSTSAPLSPDSPTLATDEEAPVDEEENSDDFEDEEDVEEGEEGEEDDASDAGSEDSHESSSSWITPDNVISHKVKDLGLFTPPTDDPSKPPKSIMKAAVLTGDFAMQNVALQMGLNVLGSGGKRVREVRTWVLRCHACFKCVLSPFSLPSELQLTFARSQDLQEPREALLPFLRRTDPHPHLHHLRHRDAREPQGLHPPPQSQLPIPSPGHAVLSREPQDGESGRRTQRRARPSRGPEGVCAGSQDGGDHEGQGDEGHLEERHG